MRPDTHPRLHMAPRLGRRRLAGGFTLIELMITVAIVGILAAVAYPSYRTSVLKGRRAEGRTALIDLAQQQERYLTQNGTYLAFNASTANVPFKTFSGDNPASAAYTLTADVCAPGIGIRECVKLTATVKRANSDPEAGNLSMTSTGLKSCDGNRTSVCW